MLYKHILYIRACCNEKWNAMNTSYQLYLVENSDTLKKYPIITIASAQL